MGREEEIAVFPADFGNREIQILDNCAIMRGECKKLVSFFV